MDLALIVGLAPQSAYSFPHLWWKKWQWGGFLTEYFGCPLSLSFHQSHMDTHYLSSMLYNFSKWHVRYI